MPARSVGVGVVERDVHRRGAQRAGQRRADRHDVPVDRRRVRVDSSMSTVGAVANLREVALEHLGDHPQRRRVADLDQRIAAGLGDRADRGAARDHGAVDRRARARRSSRRHRRASPTVGLGARELGLALARAAPARRRARCRPRRRTCAIVSWRATSWTAASCSATAAASCARAAAASGDDSVTSGSPVLTRSPVLTWTRGDPAGDRHVDLRHRAVAKRDPRRARARPATTPRARPSAVATYGCDCRDSRTLPSGRAVDGGGENDTVSDPTAGEHAATDRDQHSSLIACTRRHAPRGVPARAATDIDDARAFIVRLTRGELCISAS